jgi:hypothetical protein
MRLCGSDPFVFVDFVDGCPLSLWMIWVTQHYRASGANRRSAWLCFGALGSNEHNQVSHNDENMDCNSVHHWLVVGLRRSFVSYPFQPCLVYGSGHGMVLGTAIWAAVDSSKIQLKRYKSGISYGPFPLFLASRFFGLSAFRGI